MSALTVVTVALFGVFQFLGEGLRFMVFPLGADDENTEKVNFTKKFIALQVRDVRRTLKEVWVCFIVGNLYRVVTEFSAGNFCKFCSIDQEEEAKHFYRFGTKEEEAKHFCRIWQLLEKKIGEEGT